LQLADEMSNKNMNNNAMVIGEDHSFKTPSFTDEDGLHTRKNSDMADSTSKSSPSIFSITGDRSPQQKKRKKSLERLTQIRQEEV